MKRKDAVDKITTALQESWVFNGKLNQDDCQVAHLVSKTNKVTHINFCPIRCEIVGGPKDGKVEYKRFHLRIDRFVGLCIHYGFDVGEIVFFSKDKNIECDSIVFIMNLKSYKFFVRVYSRPAKELNLSVKINFDQELI